ncbi:unnamed protein product, partial [Mesorhabditis belari]|uniref:PHD-type domain-containing protein n=1 Tax=Mesorhabditis belari TaxID=2138241 RepID=A0AAF3EFA5_9BILA
MASCKQLFSSPLTCHSLTYRTAEFLVVDFDKKGQIPSLKFPMNDPEPQIIRITNKHPTEAMCLQVFPPLPRDAWDKPFGHIWSTMTNEWFLEIDGWQFDSRLSESPRSHCKIYKLKPGVTKEMKIHGRQVKQETYGLKLYGWVKGMKIADQVMVACQKYGTPLGHGKKPITPSDFHAMEFAAFCELQASIDDVALQIDAGVVVPVIPIEQYIFDVLDKRIRHKDNNSDEDGALIDFIHTSTSQPRGYENALSDKNQDTHIRKNDGCPKCHKTMCGKACLRCQDGCLKWWHTRCFDTTLHYRADEAKARVHDGKLLCAACRQGI